MALNPHAPLFMPENCSRLFAKDRQELLTKMDLSTSQDITDPIVPAMCPKTSSDSNSPTVSDELHKLTIQVDQLRIKSEQALEQTKPLIRTFPLISMKQFHYLHAVQNLETQLSADLKIEKHERLKLHATIHQLEEELTHLRRQVNEPSLSSLPVLSTVNPSCSTTLQGKRALEHSQILKPIPTITLMGASGTLEPRIKQLEEKISRKRDCREALLSTFRSQFIFLQDKIRALESGGTDTMLGKLTSLMFVFDNAKSSTQLDDAAKDPNDALY